MTITLHGGKTQRVDTRSGDRHLQKSRNTRLSKWEKRIICVDGEGWGTDEYGRQNYMLMVAADDAGWYTHLYTGKRLTTHECLTFLWELPTAHLTSFVFSYDVAQILRDVPYDVQCKIFDNGFDWPPVLWQGWGLGFVSHKMLRISRYGKGNITIYDGIGFWQQSLIKVLESSKGIDPEKLAIIREGKAGRGADTQDVEFQIKYSAAECSTFAQVQRGVFEACRSAGYPLSSFYGAGSLAKAMLRKNNALHAIQPLELLLPKGRSDEYRERENQRLAWFLDAAYFGGRFEISGCGYLPQIFMADIHNAYPHAATLLPCLHNANLRPSKKRDVVSLPLGVWEVRFHCDDGITWGPLPQREKDGSPIWPFTGHTIAYTPEIVEASKMPGVHIQIVSGYEFVPGCGCKPFEWLKDAYHKRQMYKKADDPREKVFKLGPNAVYGAVAQHVGKPKYRSMFLAGLITSYTRTKLLRAIRNNPTIVAVATDSAWSVSPLELEYGDELGKWGDEGTAEDVWIVQPGLAYSEHDLKLKKTRGIPLRVMNELHGWDLLIDQWRDKWHTTEPVEISLDVERFVGLGLAKNLNDPTMAGRWQRMPRRVKFGSDKRPMVYAHGIYDRPLWRDTYPAPVTDDHIYLADRTKYAEILAEIGDMPDVPDDLTDIIAGYYG